MKIALVAPSPVPFQFGGTESLVIEIQRHIHSHTPHRCEVLKIPIRENSFWSIIESYYAFHTLDISHFDMVISTKYPSFMVHHPRHILYLVHPFRQVYDMYHAFGLPHEVPREDRHRLVQDTLMRIQAGDNGVDEIFDLLFSIRNDRWSYPPGLFSVPGPFLMTLLHYFDQQALSPSRIKKYCAISERVKNREGYFPDNVPVKVLHPPSSRGPCVDHKLDYPYALSVTRLASTKRIDLLIEAMDYVSPEIHLKIVGEGPEEEKLRELAHNNSRIEFLGFVTNQELEELYSSAFALPFVPKDEEYGLVVLEAMHCHTPVITANDSGGPLELVQEGVNGFIVNPDPKEIAGKITYLYTNPRHAQELGNHGHELVNTINRDFLKGILTEWLE